MNLPETETGEDELNPLQKMNSREFVRELCEKAGWEAAHEGVDFSCAPHLLEAAARIRSVEPALRLALSALEAEFCQRQDSGDDEYISAIRAPMDAVRDALGAWEE